MNRSIRHFENETMLDNPIWNSLVTRHSHIAVGASVGHGLIRRYPSDVGPLSAFQEPAVRAYADLAAATPDGDVAALFLNDEPGLPAGWELVRGGRLVQMVCPAVPKQVFTV
jgi:hypothetical protein